MSFVHSIDQRRGILHLSGAQNAEWRVAVYLAVGFSGKMI